MIRLGSNQVWHLNYSVDHAFLDSLPSNVLHVTISSMSPILTIGMLTPPHLYATHVSPFSSPHYLLDLLNLLDLFQSPLTLTIFSFFIYFYLVLLSILFSISNFLLKPANLFFNYFCKKIFFFGGKIKKNNYFCWIINKLISF